MSNAENIAIVRQLLNAVSSEDHAALERLVAPTWVNHDPSLPPMQGHEGIRQLSGMFHTAFPDVRMEFEDVLADGDKVAARFCMTGTNTGSFMGMPPSGKSINVTATGIFRLRDGKVTDNWVNLDVMGLMQQVGAIPAQG